MSSKIIVDTIEKKTGDDVTLVGNLDVPTSYKITGTDADSIQAPGLITSAGGGLNTSLNTGLASANIKPAFTGPDSSTTNGPTSGSAVTKNTTLPIFACRAWVNFDGNSVDGSDNCAVRASGNVEKVVRTGTGQYEIHFLVDMPDVNYCVMGIAGTNENVTYTRNLCQMYNQIGYTKIFTVTSGGSLSSDTEHITVAVFR